MRITTEREAIGLSLFGSYVVMVGLGGFPVPSITISDHHWNRAIVNINPRLLHSKSNDHATRHHHNSGYLDDIPSGGAGRHLRPGFI